MNSQQEIRSLLQTFQDGYTRRDITQLDTFMALFTPIAEVIGTNGVKPGEHEWYTSRDSARNLVEGDWNWWGDLRLDVDSASIQVHGNVGWIATTATVTKTMGTESYASFLESIKEYIETSSLPAKEKLHFILRDGTNTIYELGRGDKFVAALRFTAVVVREADGWKFAQVNFSYPTNQYPDVRIVD
jgi:hypothetical protein